MDLHHLPRPQRYVDSNDLSPWLNSTPSDQRAGWVRNFARTNRDAEKVLQRHRPWRVKRETCEKGATWTDWVPISFGPSRSAILRAVFLLP